jgi:hypothetical protein
MSETNSANALQPATRGPASCAICGMLAIAAAATWLGSALAQPQEKIPDFSWIANRPGS